jgi:4-hydroxy-2-oxoheptanedioate aldolase
MERKTMGEPTLNLVKQSLRDGKPVTALVVTIPSVATTQIWARSGIDLLLFDMEHGAIDIATLHAMIVATTGTSAVPVVRVPSNLPWLVKPALDAGALGIMFPMIATAEDARTAVRSMRYPPEGERGWGPFLTQFRWNLPLTRYVDIANDEVLTILQIERPEAVQNIEEIVRVPGIDMLLIAPFDLSTTMGYRNHPEHPDVQQAIAKLEGAIRASGIPMAGAALSADAAKQVIERGYLGLFVGFDWMVLQRAAATLTEGLKL